MPDQQHDEVRAHEVVDRALELLLAHDMAGFAGLFAADGVVEFPFAATGYPTRLDGRAAVAEYLRGYPDLVDVHAVTAKTVHQTLDPGVVVVEFEVAGAAVRTREHYRMRYVAVVTVRGGEIARYRDYWSPLAAAEAVGGADRLATFGAGR